MNIIQELRIYNCLGFNDSGSVELTSSTGPICIIGRNSSGKTSLIDAIACFAYGTTPKDFPRFANFSPRGKYRPTLSAHFAHKSFDTAEHRKRILAYLQANGFTGAVQNDPRGSKFLERLYELYDDCCNTLSTKDKLWVHKMGDGEYAFLDPDDAYAAHNSRVAKVDGLIAGTFPSTGFLIGTSSFVVKLNATAIDNLLFLNLPTIVAFKDQFSLSDDLPERIDPSLLSALPSRNSLTQALVLFLGQEDVASFLTINDPDDRQDALGSLQERLRLLCARIHSFEANDLTPNPLLDVTIHENNGLQLTFRADGKKCFYRQLSDTTKLLFAFHLYAEAHHLEGAVLLFDEPNAGFHPSAQGYVLRFLQRLSLENQVVFTTHSQHMIDLDRLGDVRLMSADSKGGLTVKNHFFGGPSTRGGDFLALQPIIDAIGLRFASQLTLKNRMIVTEGLTDMLYLRAFKMILGIPADLSIAPARGDSTIAALISFLIAQGVEFKLLVDTSRVVDKIQEDFGLDQKVVWRVPKWRTEKTSGIEDLFSKADFRVVLERHNIAIDDAAFDNMANSRYIDGSKRVLAYKFYQEACHMDATSFAAETLEGFRAALEFCGNSDWCVL